MTDAAVPAVVPSPAVMPIVNGPITAPDAPIVVAEVPSIPDGPVLPTFTMTYREFSFNIQACDETAARAMFNDRIQRWPSPREVTCVPVVDPPAKS